MSVSTKEHDHDLELDKRQHQDAEAGGIPALANVDDDAHVPNQIHELVSDVPLAGVRRVETVQAVWTKKSRWVLFIALGLASYIYSLDGTTAWQYAFYATSSVFGNMYSGAIDTAGAIIIAVGKPLMAKLSDVFGRAEAYCIVIAFYVIGYICKASAQGVGALAGGTIIYSFGYTGLQLLSQIIIADTTTLRWRGLSSALLSTPFIINAFVSAEIANGILPNWRWGYGMFAILVPACLAPIVGVMFWAQIKAKKMYKNEIAAARALPRKPIGTILYNIANEMDLIGLILVAASLALILLPFTLAPLADGKWNNPSMIAMIVIGFVIFPGFCFWDAKYAKYPIVPYKFLKNPTILASCIIGFTDFVSFYLQYTNLYNFVFVTKDWDARYMSYFGYTQTIALTVFGIMAGAIMSYTREVKWIMFTGLLIRLAGVGMMLHSRGARGSTAELVINQVLQGMGGGFAATCIQVAAQSQVPHVSVATVTAMVLLITEVGNSVGTAAATSIFTTHMPGAIAKHVPGNNATLNALLFSAPSVYGRDNPLGSPIRDGFIQAYEDVMFKQVLAATIVAILPPIACLLLTKRIKLEDVQNLADGRDLAGKPTEVSRELGIVDDDESKDRRSL
ncbi:major facilitator superfamily domain-containing protein [Filobasidium floriforme]|uniref:major facilitator superfamily domain-containing protein n=1 Tax=Filobasidium floriforme TaxID=5210 RepID=UPI001E8EA2AD|nr:major facilitator superfamily domain-containing protein [Filobasidium floriforme]KAH8083649.1 major facilitator superfamily domain-containing protein [Filobasidium floriforme]